MYIHTPDLRRKISCEPKRVVNSFVFALNAEV